MYFVKGQQEKEEGLWYLYAGVFAGIALMFKQVALFNFLAFFPFLFSLVKNRFGESRLQFDLAAAGRLVLGCLLVPTVVVVYFALRGALPDLIYDVLLVNYKYFNSLGIAVSQRMIYGGLATLSRANVENSLIWLFGLLGVLFIFLKDRSRQNIIVLAWALGSCLGIAATGLFYGHYYIQLIPALCLLSAYALWQTGKQTSWWFKLFLVLVALLLIVRLVPYQYPYYLKYGPDEISEHQYGYRSSAIAYRLAQQFKQILKPEDQILVWSANPQFYFYLEKKAPTRYFCYLGWMEDERVKAEILAAIFEQPPDYVIWTDYTLPYEELMAFIKQNYQPYLRAESWRVFKKIK
jgi:hypothetical protein